MNVVNPAPSPAQLRAARLAFRAARHALARAVLADDERALLAACWRLLRANDRLMRVAAHPTTRDERTRRRWRGFALAAINHHLAAGLACRARRLYPQHDHNGGAKP
jgi:hypothetical protein